MIDIEPIVACSSRTAYKVLSRTSNIQRGSPKGSELKKAAAAVALSRSEDGQVV